MHTAARANLPTCPRMRVFSTTSSCWTSRTDCRARRRGRSVADLCKRWRSRIVNAPMRGLSSRVVLVLLLALVPAAAPIACKKKGNPAPTAASSSAQKGDEDEEMEDEEKEAMEDHLWRVAITIEGQGVVKTNIEGIPEMSIKCVRDEK